MQAGEFRPQALLALSLLRIIVKSLAVLAAEAALFFHHLDQQLLLRLVDGIGAKVCFGRLHDLEHEVERDLVGER